MNHTNYSLALELLAIAEIKAVVEQMIKVKQQADKNRHLLTSDTWESDNSIVHTTIEASVENLQTRSTEPVRILETTYTIDKTTGDLEQHEACIQEWLPENDGDTMDMLY